MLGKSTTALNSLREASGHACHMAASIGLPIRPDAKRGNAVIESCADKLEDRTDAKPLSLVLVFSAFFLLAIVQTWPLALHLDDHAIAWPGDSYVMWWNMAWLRESLFSLSNPFYTDVLYYPQGSDLYLHTLSPVNGLVTIPFQVISGGNLLLSWNITMLLFFALSGTGGYLLSYHVTQKRWASLVGGFVFAFSPHVMMQLNGHFHIATTWPIPFFVLFLLRFIEERSKADLVLVAILGSIVTWNWLEFTVDLALFAMLAFAFSSFLSFRGQRCHEVFGLTKALLPGVALWALLSAPILIPTVLEIQSGDYSVTMGKDEAVGYSPDLLAYVVQSPLWGPGQYANNYDNFGPQPSTLAGSIETTMFLGLTPLLLSILAFVHFRKSTLRHTVWFWSLVFIFFALLALGPRLFVFAIDTGIPMPFRLMQEVPLIGERRVPGRMIIVGTLALGVLASLGVSVAARYLPRRAKYASVPLVTCLVLALVLVEYWNPPAHLVRYDTPPVYEAIARESGDFAVLDLPLGRVTGNTGQGDAMGGALSDYAQVVHGKRAIGGYLSRAKTEDLDWLAEQPGLGYLSCLDCSDYPRTLDLDREQVRQRFTELGIKYVVVNLITFEGNPTIIATDELSDDVQTYLEDTLGLADAGSGDGWFAYRNPDIQ